MTMNGTVFVMCVVAGCSPLCKHEPLSIRCTRPSEGQASPTTAASPKRAKHQSSTCEADLIVLTCTNSTLSQHNRPSYNPYRYLQRSIWLRDHRFQHTATRPETPLKQHDHSSVSTGRVATTIQVRVGKWQRLVTDISTRASP